MRQFKRSNFIIILGIIVALFLISGCWGINFSATVPNSLSLPHVDEILPANSIVGSVITINGSNFGTTQGSVTFFDDVDAGAYTSWEDTQIICTVPAGAETGTVMVTNTVGQSNDDIIFTVIKAWVECYGGSNNDYSYSIQQTIDGGYIVAGYSNSNDGDVSGNHGDDDYWVVKVDDEENIEWQRCYGGSSSDRAYSIQQTIDGGYIVAGYSNSNDGDVSGNHGNGDVWVVKLDNAGNIEWQKCYGGSGTDRAKSIQQTEDGGYIVAGSALSNNGDVSGNHGNNDYWVVKIDDAGNIEWQKCLGGSITDRANSIQQTADGGYIVAGETNSYDGDVSGNHGVDAWDYWVVKLDDAGNIEWQKCLGGSNYDYAYSIQQTEDGGYIVAGDAASNNDDVSGNHGGYDYWVVKLDDAGNIEWQKCLGGSLTDRAKSIQQTTDGGYIVAGEATSNNGDVTGNNGGYDYWIVKIDEAGNIEWQKCLGGSAGDYALSIQQASDGGYILAGYTASNDGDVSGNNGGNDYWIIKTDSAGNF